MRACVVKEGASAPLGATVSSAGVNFSVFSKSTTLVELLLFDDENAAQPAQVIPLDGNRHRTYHYWHVFVPELKPGRRWIDTALQSSDDIRRLDEEAIIELSTYVVEPRTLVFLALWFHSGTKRPRT